MGRRRYNPRFKIDPEDNALDCVTTRLGWLVVDQTDGCYPPFAVIQISRTQPRQPSGTNELSLLSRELNPATFRPIIYENKPGQKYCSRCGEWQPRCDFSPKGDAHDGLHPYCKSCRARERRRMYWLMKQETVTQKT